MLHLSTIEEKLLNGESQDTNDVSDDNKFADLDCIPKPGSRTIFLQKQKDARYDSDAQKAGLRQPLVYYWFLKVKLRPGPSNKTNYLKCQSVRCWKLISIRAAFGDVKIICELVDVLFANMLFSVGPDSLDWCDLCIYNVFHLLCQYRFKFKPFLTRKQGHIYLAWIFNTTFCIFVLRYKATLQFVSPCCR